MTILQRTAIGATLFVALGAWVFQEQQNSKLSERLQVLQQEQQTVIARLNHLEEEHDKAKRQLTEFRNSPQPIGRLDTSNQAFPQVSNVVAPPSVGLESELDMACGEPSRGKREAAMKHISKSILPSDIPRAVAHLATRPGMNGVESPLFSELASKWGESDPNAAVAWVSSLGDATAQKTALEGILNGWTHVSPQAAADYAAKLPAGDLQNAAVFKVINEWSFKDPSGPAAWVSTFPEGKLRDQVVEPIIFWGQGACPAAIADMLDAIGSDELIQKHGEMLGRIWLTRDAPAARAWIAGSALPADAKQGLLSPVNEQK